jgi:hypothetical protein
MLTMTLASTTPHSGPHLLAWSPSQVWIILVVAGLLVGFLGLVFVRCRMRAK